MKKKYSIALLPQDESAAIIDLSHKLSHLADKYILGENSVPHVTIRQFEVDEQLVECQWDRVLSELNSYSLHLSFSEISYLTFDGKIFWVSLLPENTDNLYKLHTTVSNALQLPVLSNYDPHMTLINSYDKETESVAKLLLSDFTSYENNFVMALGTCDEVGQFTEIIYSSVNNECKFSV